MYNKSNDSDINTVEYIQKHRKRVKQWMILFATEILNRANIHDESKLQEPELSGWIEMDKKPRYKYGTKKYFEKLKKFEWLFKLHWSKNRHHPEYWKIHKNDKSRDAVDLLETLCDWLAYKDKLSYKEAVKIVKQQSKRYETSKELQMYVLNTLKNVFVDFGIEKNRITSIDEIQGRMLKELLQKKNKLK